MSILDERIAQFENMAQADPENDMAHFSLGNAYLQARRYAEASKSLHRCLELNPDMSKAFQLCGEAMIGAGWEDQAVETLNKGYETASAKGDLMPKNAIAELLQGIGRTVPVLSEETEAAAEQLQSSGTFVCARTGRSGSQLKEPPMRGEIGQWIYENIAAETWQLWIEQGTKVINELRLDFSREEDQHAFDLQMYEYLGINPDEILEKAKAES